MANIKILFLGTDEDHVELSCFINSKEEITVMLETGSDDPESISLDIPTAIKFTKTLRTLINQLKESEGNHE